MTKVFLTLDLDPASATLDQVVNLLHLESGDIDEEFGLVRIGEGRYTILVEDEMVDADAYATHSNPPIEPFGRL